MREVPEWRATVLKTIRVIKQNLDQNLALTDAADKALYSPYHLHRVFKAMTGETPVEMGRRLRLEKGAWLLSESESSISEVAIECGFGSLEGFERAFSQAYGEPPKRWRSVRKQPRTIESVSGIHYRPGCPDCPDIPLPFGDKEMSINIVQMAPMRVLSMRGIGDYWGMVELWPKFVAYLKQQGVPMENAWFFTLFQDPDDSVPFEQKRYDVSISVPEGFEAPTDESFIQEFKGGEYVIYTFRGDNEGIGPAWDHFRQTWLPEHRYRLKPGLPSVEWYRTGPCTPSEHLLTDLCDPIEPV